MAELSDKVTNALNEVRILVLGAQVLLGFQFQAVFQPRFAALASLSRWLDGAAYSLMLIAFVLLLSPASFHRVRDRGDDTRQLHSFTTVVAAFALLPFAVSIGLDVFIVADLVFGRPVATIAGLTMTVLAVLAWYGAGFFRKALVPSGQQRMEEFVRTPLNEKIKTLGTEIRVILPGAQALLGFQFAAILTDAFEKLPEFAKVVHLSSLGLIATSIILLMAPAAYHRIATAGNDTKDVESFGVYAMLIGMGFLALGLAGDLCIVLGVVSSWAPLAIFAPIAWLAMAFAFWFIYPLAGRTRRNRQARGT
jgi:hypothetical protein